MGHPLHMLVKDGPPAILQSRGADLSGLDPETLPPVMQLDPLGIPKTGSEAGAEPEPEPLDIPE